MSLAPSAEEGAASAPVAPCPSVAGMVPWVARARLRGGSPACEGAVREAWRVHM